MAIFDFLFGSKNAPPVETTNISTSEIPKYIAEPTADIIGEAMDVGKEAYIPYGGPRLAGLSQIEQDAITQAQAMGGVQNVTRGVTNRDGTMEYITFATTGNASDFGDASGSSDGQGGVGDYFGE